MTRALLIFVRAPLRAALQCECCGDLIPAGVRAWTWRERGQQRAACERWLDDVVGLQGAS